MIATNGAAAPSMNEATEKDPFHLLAPLPIQPDRRVQPQLGPVPQLTRFALRLQGVFHKQ